ncbi:DUF2141 domain-containing protein [Massilia norwichensis]|jgi:uncharacterized protein (DUF2141 family)|uniref:DUF2141 domain-containing protein n=1 Tax=Massilia norwichensis TaxID=1442366 RepID=A0ABT2A4E7_9BURK|nr:DUF2141 domain-containing protein [Massilia norwichensis]MCS0588955.1 DUF2141 domain-containing protein [Massilia norwichensis]
MTRFTHLLAGGLLLAAAAASATASAATVEVRVTEVAGGKGSVKVAVCDRERFLKQCAYSASAPARDGENVILVPNVPKGTWAVLAYQDENGNGELDRNLLGIPKENYGFSRDAASKFGPPGFDDAKIEVGDEPTVAKIRLH